MNFIRQISNLFLAIIFSSVLNVTYAMNFDTPWRNLPVKTSCKYSVNLMWINSVLNTNQLYIHPSENETDLHKNFLNYIFKWAAVSKGSTINLWYDGLLTPATAVANTCRLIYEKKITGLAPILLRDIRQIPKVAQNPDIFGENVPVYFRSDILRPIIALYLLNNRETHCCVYFDLVVEPLSQEQIFDVETCQNLHQYGIVMAHNNEVLSQHSYENYCQIISDDNMNLLKAVDWALIEVNIARCKRALQGKLFKAYDGLRCPPMYHIVEAVYKSYEKMWEYFCSLEGLGTFRNDSKIYNKEVDGLKPFGISLLTEPLSFYTGISWTNWLPIFMPVKNVDRPSPTISEYYAKEPLFNPSSKNYTAYATDHYPNSISEAEDL